mmetsp:Transcript_69799/g.214033  ORF Transcript_69799/g.214033 Transcript_69799/m.214033 type:complete len:210 (-) Transcript_69799:312-941(-)
MIWFTMSRAKSEDCTKWPRYGTKRSLIPHGTVFAKSFMFCNSKSWRANTIAECIRAAGTKVTSKDSGQCAGGPSSQWSRNCSARPVSVYSCSPSSVTMPRQLSTTLNSCSLSNCLSRRRSQSISHFVSQSIFPWQYPSRAMRVCTFSMTAYATTSRTMLTRKSRALTSLWSSTAASSSSSRPLSHATVCLPPWAWPRANIMKAFKWPKK